MNPRGTERIDDPPGGMASVVDLERYPIPSREAASIRYLDVTVKEGFRHQERLPRDQAHDQYPTPSHGSPLAPLMLDTATLPAPPLPSQTLPSLVQTHPRLRVQRSAARTKRRHFVRAARRLGVLATMDSFVLVALRGILQFLRDATWSGAVITSVLPEGVLGGWGAIAAFFAGLVFAGAYSSEESWASPWRVVKGISVGAALGLWQSIDSQGIGWTVPRWVALSIGVGAPMAMLRGLLGFIVINYRFAARPTDRVILVGDPDTEDGRLAAEAVIRRPGMQSNGWLSEKGRPEDYLGHPSAVWEVLCETGTDTVVLCDTITPEVFESVVEAAAVAGCKVLSVRSRTTLMASRPRALRHSQLRMLELTFPAARAGQAVIKRMFDTIVAVSALLLLSPLLVVLSLWIKLDSPGPVFFIQDRVGQAGRIFRMVKFRTMRNGADSQKRDLAHLNGSGDSRLFKIPNDPRVTKAGAFLRRWSLDELPQLLNVVSGDMSLVGPRPFFESDLAAYDDHHFIRLAVKPGVTGLWQVRGRSSIVDFDEVVRLDSHYVNNWSFPFDLWILLLTIPAVFRRTGAY